MRPEDVIGIDVGGSKILARMGAWSETVANCRDCPPNRLVGIINDLTERAAAAGHRPRGIGIGFPGLVAADGARVRSSVILDGWVDVPLAAMLSDRSGVAARVDNDVNCWALGELASRPEQPSFLLLTIGTGVGGAIVLDRRLWRGRSGLAGEIGHNSVDPQGAHCLCGRRGCVGPLVGGEGLCIELALDAGTLGGRIASGDPAARSAIDWRAEALGGAVADALNLLDIGLVVLGGGLAPAFLPGVTRGAGQAFAEIVVNTTVELARAGTDGAAIGAACLLADGQ